MEKSMKARARPAETRPHEGAGGETSGLPGGLAYAWMGGPWIEAWVDIWSAWMDVATKAGSASQSSGEAGDRRHLAVGIPWVPRVESTVVPLRRSSDPPGATSSRISMRLQMPTLPWLGDGGSNVIAIDALVPRITGAESEPRRSEQHPVAAAKH